MRRNNAMCIEGERFNFIFDFNKGTIGPYEVQDKEGKVNLL